MANSRSSIVPADPFVKLAQRLVANVQTSRNAVATPPTARDIGRAAFLLSPNFMNGLVNLSRQQLLRAKLSVCILVLRTGVAVLQASSSEESLLLSLSLLCW